MGVWEDHGITSYPDYWRTDWWKSLKDFLIYSNELASCYICGKRNTLWHIINRKSLLVIHHVSYKNLFQERLYKDVFIICHDCHHNNHYWVLFWFITWRLPRTYPWLILSLTMRKALFLVQKRQFGLSAVFILLALYLVIYNLFLYSFKKILHLVGKLVIAILGIAFS